MRICLVSQKYPPETGGEGIGTYIYEMAHAFARIGHQVTVISQWLEGAPEEIQDGPVRVFRVRPQRLFLSPLIRSYWRAIRWFGWPLRILEHSKAVAEKINELSNTESFDIIEFPERDAESYFYGKHPRVPYVVKLHHIPYRETARLSGQGWNYRVAVVDWLERKAALGANGLSSPTRHLGSIVMGLWRLPKPMVAVPNPIDTSSFSPGKRVRQMRQLTVLYAGRFDLLKGMEVLFRAIPLVLRKVPNAHFVLIGPETLHPLSKRPLVASLLERYGSAVSTHVELLRPVPRDRLVTYYRNSDLFVMPSLYDNLPYGCLEAMACGLPIVASRCGGIPEMVSEVCGLLVEPGNAGELARAIVALLTDVDLRLAMGRAARERTENIYSSERVAAQTLAFYETILSRSPREWSRF